MVSGRDKPQLIDASRLDGGQVGEVDDRDLTLHIRHIAGDVGRSTGAGQGEVGDLRSGLWGCGAQRVAHEQACEQSDHGDGGHGGEGQPHGRRPPSRGQDALAERRRWLDSLDAERERVQNLFVHALPLIRHPPGLSPSDT